MRGSWLLPMFAPWLLVLGLAACGDLVLDCLVLNDKEYRELLDTDPTIDVWTEHIAHFPTLIRMRVSQPIRAKLTHSVQRHCNVAISEDSLSKMLVRGPEDNLTSKHRP